MSKAFIVYPEGDFDNNAELVSADTPEEAALDWYERGEVGIGATLCVLPFDDVKEYKLKVAVDHD